MWSIIGLPTYVVSGAGIRTHNLLIKSVLQWQIDSLAQVEQLLLQ